MWPLSIVSRTINEVILNSLKARKILSLTSDGAIVRCNFICFTLPLDANNCHRLPFGTMELNSCSSTTVMVDGFCCTLVPAFFFFFCCGSTTHSAVGSKKEHLTAFGRQEKVMQGQLLQMDT